MGLLADDLLEGNAVLHHDVHLRVPVEEVVLEVVFALADLRADEAEVRPVDGKFDIRVVCPLAISIVGVQGTLGLEDPLTRAASRACLHVGVDPHSELLQNLVAELHMPVGLKEELLFLDDVVQPIGLGL